MTITVIEKIDNEASESPDSTRFKAMKIRIKDEEHSRLVQETLFGMGYKWLNGQTTYFKVWHDYIVTRVSDKIVQSSCDELAEEMELVTTYSFQPAKSEKDLKIEALQKQIDALQEQLNELKND